MSHTPGPWGATYDGSSDWSIGPEPDPQGNRVAGVWDSSDDRAGANVALIAAAPEMLLMLKRLEWSGTFAVEDWVEDDHCPLCKYEKRKHMDDCKLAALIAKAEGK